MPRYLALALLLIAVLAGCDSGQSIEFEVLKNPDHSTALTGLRTVGVVNDEPSPAAQLVTALNYDDPDVRVMAACALAELGDSAAEAAPALVQAMNDEVVRVNAALALGHVGDKSSTVISTLTKGLDDPLWSMRWACARSLNQLGVESKIEFPADLAASRDANWPGWRGPDGNGLSPCQDPPLHWSSEENVAWKTELPGRGHSSPIVWEDRVFVTSATPADQRRWLICLGRRSGEILWKRTVLVAPLERVHENNNYASATPATDGRRVFVSFLDRQWMYVAAYDFHGHKLWEARPGEFHSKHGFSSSVVVYRDRIILNGDHDGDAYLAMLRTDDGETVWKTRRENKKRSYSTPLVVPVAGRDQIVLTGGKCTAGYDAESGRQIWVCQGPSEQMVASVVFGHGHVYAAGGYPDRHLLAIRPDGQGDVTMSHESWRLSKGVPYVPSPLLYGDYLHLISDQGIYQCVDPRTGRSLCRKRLTKGVSGSIMGAGGYVFVTDEYGTTVVMKNGSDVDIVARNQLGEPVFASPAVVGKQMLIRGEKHLYCIGGDKGT